MELILKYFPDLTPKQIEQFAALGRVYSESRQINGDAGRAGGTGDREQETEVRSQKSKVSSQSRLNLRR